MKNARVIVKTTVGSHQISVELNGERTLYAVTNKLRTAKDLVQKAKRELGIAKGSKTSGAFFAGQIREVKFTQPGDAQQP
jgi:hypothetical protein